MNIEHLVEPKLKDLEKQIKNLQHLSDIEHAIQLVEFDIKNTGLLHSRSGSMITQRESGDFLISYQVQKL